MSTPSSGAAGKASAHASAFAAAFVDTISVGVGMFPLGTAFGLLVVQSGLDWWWALIFSVLVYAGSMFAVTFALRALPFAVLRPLRDSALVGYLSRHMPAGIMVILVVYTLRGVSLSEAPHGLPEALALVVTVALHLWKRNAVAGIIGGTAVYIALVNLVFV